MPWTQRHEERSVEGRTGLDLQAFTTHRDPRESDRGLMQLRQFRGGLGGFRGV